MNENDDQITTQDVLRSSELTARLLRRLTGSPGVIDIQMPRQLYARLTEWLAHSVSLLDDLTARYSIDDGSRAGNQPLIMEQPSMVNINAYLTSNSFTSTTQSFSPAPPSSDALRSVPASIISPRKAAHSDAKTMLPELAPPSSNTSSSPVVEKFRFSRSPKRRARETAQADVQAVAQKPVLSKDESLNFVASTPAHIADDKDRFAKPEEEKEIEPTLSQVDTTSTIDTTSTPLPLQAQTQVAPAQLPRKAPDAGVPLSQSVARAYEIKDDLRHAQDKQALITAGASFQHDKVNPVGEVDKTIGSSHPAPAKADVPATSLTTLSPVRQQITSSLALVQKQIASSLPRPRAPELIWRQGGDAITMREPTESRSGSGPLPSARRSGETLPPAQSPQSNQIITPEPARRTGTRPMDSGVTTERILRNISRQLLIERERRGY